MFAPVLMCLVEMRIFVKFVEFVSTKRMERVGKGVGFRVGWCCCDPAKL